MSKSKKVIEADVEVVSSTKSNKQKSATPAKATKRPAKDQQADNPFAAFGAGGMGGMGGAGMDGMPDLSALFGKDGMPDLSKMPGIPLKQRLMFKFMRLLSSPKLRFLKSKWSFPIWGVIAIVVVGLLLTVGVVFLLFKLLRALLGPYLDIFKRK